jgi:hypothetical protein
MIIKVTLLRTCVLGLALFIGSYGCGSERSPSMKQSPSDSIKAQIPTEQTEANRASYDASPIGTSGGADVTVVELHAPSPLNSVLTVVRVLKSGFSPSIVGVTRSQPAGHSVLGALKRGQFEVLLAGGFMEALVPPTPVGLLVIDGQTINRVNPKGYSTILAVRDGSLYLVPRDSLGFEAVDGALQTGPRLIENGQVTIYPTEPESRPAATRAFVGFQEDGEILLGITHDPVHLYHLATYLAAPPDSRVLPCYDAVNLCGGGVEALAVAVEDSVVSLGNASLRQASMLGFRRKR